MSFLLDKQIKLPLYQTDEQCKPSEIKRRNKTKKGFYFFSNSQDICESSLTDEQIETVWSFYSGSPLKNKNRKSASEQLWKLLHIVQPILKLKFPVTNKFTQITTEELLVGSCGNNNNNSKHERQGDDSMLKKTDEIILMVTENPRRPNTLGFKSMQIIIDHDESESLTVEKFLQLGGRLKDLRWDIAKKNVSIK